MANEQETLLDITRLIVELGIARRMIQGRTGVGHPRAIHEVTTTQTQGLKVNWASAPIILLLTEQ